MEDKSWELSYPADITTWDGESIKLLPEETIRENFSLLKDVGLNYGMLGGIHYEEKFEFEIDDACRMVRQLLDEYKLEPSSFHCVLPTYAPIDRGQDEVLEKMAKTAEFSGIFRPAALVVHPCRINEHHDTVQSIFDGFIREREKHGEDKVMDTIAENLYFLGNKAEQHNIKIAVENLGFFSPFGCTETISKLIDKCNHPNVGYCLDSGHAHAFRESLPALIRRMGNKIYETHLHDNRGLAQLGDQEFIQATKANDEHLAVGFGTISWPDVITVLREVGFPGPINFETMGWPVDDKKAGLELAIKWWRTCEKLATKLN